MTSEGKVLKPCCVFIYFQLSQIIAVTVKVRCWCSIIFLF